MAKRWQCTVCGYIHVGNEPPESCPVCGADKSKFIALAAEDSGFFRELVAAFKLHPVLAHFPGGLMPTAVLFLLVYMITKQPGLEAASYWLVMVLTIVVPFSLVTGIRDWHKYFGKQRAPVFYKKFTLALTLLTLGVVAIALRYDQPGLLTTDSWHRWLYLLCLAGMLTSISLLGHYGSLLMVQAIQRQERPDRPAATQGK